MVSRLRLLGSAWLPLLEEAVEALTAGGLDVSGVWGSAGERQHALGRLARLLDLVVTWNARIDLTAARGERELVDLYLADALVLAALSCSGPSSESGARVDERWLDVGSGAGAPGLALALLWPRPVLTLVEPRRKRVAFLRSAVGAFPGAARVSVVEGRSDNLPPGEHEVAVSRATFAPEEWLREGARLARGGVWVLLARAQPPALAGFEVASRADYDWPLTRAPRSALLYRRAENALPLEAAL